MGYLKDFQLSSTSKPIPRDDGPHNIEIAGRHMGRS